MNPGGGSASVVSLQARFPSAAALKEFFTDIEVEYVNVMPPPRRKRSREVLERRGIFSLQRLCVAFALEYGISYSKIKPPPRRGGSWDILHAHSFS